MECETVMTMGELGFYILVAMVIAAIAILVCSALLWVWDWLIHDLW